MNTQQQTQQVIRVNEIANEIYQQIKSTFNIYILWSWGIDKKEAMIYRNFPSLALKVNGYIHKGWVIISLNEGADLYNIYLLDRLMNEKEVIEDVFCEDLTILDSLIETGKMTEQEYKDKVKSDYLIA